MPRQSPYQRRETAANIHLDANPHYLQVVSWLLKLRFMTTEQLGCLLDPPRSANAVYKLVLTRFFGV